MPTRLPQRIARALRSFVRRRTVEQELEDELRFHFEAMAAHETTRTGSATGGRQEARRRFGGLNQVKEACRDMRTLRPLEHLLQDLRFGARLLLRGPLFTIVAVLSLALGIGANSAIFSVINAIVLRPLPIPSPSELFIAEAANRGDVSQRFSWPLVEHFRDALAGRAEICAQSTTQPMLTADAGATAAGPEPAQVQLLSGECFGLLRQHAQIGRLLGPDDNRTRGGHPVAVLSDAYWSGHFGRSPAAIGRELVINGTAMTIVGVTQPGFFGTAVDARTADIWAPVMMQAELRYAGNLSNSNGDPHKPWVPQRELSWLNVMLRAPHGSEGAIAAEANTIAQQDYAQWSGVAGDAEFRDRLRATRISLLPGARGFSDVRARLQTPLIVLLAMVGLVLVVACANLASLLLARATHRQREMAIRLSIGAGRGRLVRQLLTESLLLALLGGAAGLVLAAWGGAALVNFGETGPASIGLDVRPDTSVLLFTLAVSIATGLLFGLLPAVRATRVSLAETLKAQTRSVAGAGRGGGSTSRLLIAAQMAFSLLLLVVAALFGRSLQQLMHVDVGFDRQHLVVARIDPQTAGYDLADLPALNRRLVDRVRALPGVTSASMSGNGPFSGSRTTSGFEAQGYTHGGDERLRTQEEVVMPAYFETVGIPIVRGRGFTAEDVAGGRNVSVINETVARRYFGGRDPIGQRWSYDTDFGKDSMEIVGIAADAHYNDVKGDSPNMVYRPAAQSDWYLESLEVSVAGDSRAVASAASTMLTVLRESEPRLAVRRVETLDSRVSRSMGQERLLTLLTALFGLVALSLACLGLYGTVSYAVTRRTAELGVRMALGADRRAVRWLILREALSVVLLGLAVGLPLTLLSVRAIGSTLHGVTSFDPPSYAIATVALLTIATLAAFVPARRASRLDPMQALRAD